VATQISTSNGGDAQRAIDGNSASSWGSGSCTHTATHQSSWWQVDLGSDMEIQRIKITNRGDCCGDVLNPFDVLVDGEPCASKVSLNQGETKEVACADYGRVVKVKTDLNKPLTICEFGVSLTPAPPPRPVSKLNKEPEAGDAEGTVYTSDRVVNEDPTRKGSRKRGRRTTTYSSIRRRMRGSYYSIADKVTYKLVKSGSQCRSRNKYYGCWLRTASDCAKKVKKEGKKFFIWYGGTEALSYHDTKCYGEKTTSESCPEGWSNSRNPVFSFFTVTG